MADDDFGPQIATASQITPETYVRFWPRRERRRVVGEVLKLAAAGR